MLFIHYVPKVHTIIVKKKVSNMVVRQKQWKASLPQDFGDILDRFVQKYPEFKSRQNFMYFASLQKIRELDPEILESKTESLKKDVKPLPEDNPT